jgi:hypothetical protein
MREDSSGSVPGASSGERAPVANLPRLYCEGAAASRENDSSSEDRMLKRTMGGVAVIILAVAPALYGQAAASARDTVVDGRHLSEWVADLKAQAPQVRNAAAYEISGLGAAAAPAVPALIEALDDSEPSVRFPVTVALGEIGPAAAAAVPKLKQMMDEERNDEVAAAAKRAIRKIKPQALAGE